MVYNISLVLLILPAIRFDVCMVDDPRIGFLILDDIDVQLHSHHVDHLIRIEVTGSNIPADGEVEIPSITVRTT